VAAGEAGASVTIASRSKVKLDTALGSIQRTSRAVVLDTRDQSALERFFMEEGPWDHVVVSAAQTPTGPVRKLGLADVDAAMESKFWGAYRVARAAKKKHTSPAIRAAKARAFTHQFPLTRQQGSRQRRHIVCDACDPHLAQRGPRSIRHRRGIT
jgi:NAD(P)-dependent dehydrogenase (short-subunit alcohol dehydrogenase family)